MRTYLITLLLSVFTLISIAQQDTTVTYRIVKTDGGELVGKILTQDAREILLVTVDGRQVYIPQHTIKEIVKVDSRDFNAQGNFVGEDRFATRYFLTTNGLPVKKGEHYVQWNLFGPDLQFGLGENLGVGVMTTWIGIPLVGSIKKSWQLKEEVHIAVGALVGTGSWAAIDIGGALPFGTISFGDRRRNIAFTGGYGTVWGFNDDWGESEVDGQFMASIAAMAKIAPKLSLVFDSFILPVADEPFGIFLPGLRWHQDEGKAVQFGFAGILTNGELVPVPIPMIQWYRSL